ncbi:ATP-binding cassette domain-containing protein [Polynucleobacter paneuropaeus]|uniref:ATP-binding cassette domain-containing protein n=1 Tax=Polynucleobacter paneuropaeus TaxID=2527775 RepID=A0AAE3CHF0_9BURK|nr:ATP-binding cassette domain-containing protein [Polynucleobacter paneuropaeus]MBT8591135.1 ATP-binding cassette domain-containing protein [Polynucleobacter paneuropaeus]MBT8596525.1 ATP-binding cassette domain-containing protein [Polynucleobacter paneuropaeus]MBT8598338.1 ATP-binding cassette domain-containing protein [Polynucleobacter paneuropaeus]
MAFAFKQVSFSHSNGKEALKNINISASAGESIAIIGSSGSGKTSLLNLMATSLRPSLGSISVLGIDPWVISKGQLRRLRSQIGFVHQAAPIPPKQRVITAVLAGRLGQWPLWKSLLSLIYPVDIVGPQSCLQKLDLADRLFDRCDRLSGGQLQRVGVARVLYQKPYLLLADEPVSAMDPVLSDLTIQRLLEDARTRDACFVASLHAVDIALRWFPRVVGLKDGEVFFDLPASDVSESLLQQLYASERGILPKQGSPNT